MPITIVIADDHEIFRKGFKVLLRKQKEVQVIGEAVNGAELLEITLQHTPDVVITDIQMPVMDGIEATRQLTESLPHIPVIALTMFHEDHLISDMIQAGAKGYLLKNTNKQELVNAIKAVHQGMNYWCQAASNRLSVIRAAKTLWNHGYHPPKLSQKDNQIIKLICQEYSSKQIASLVGLTPRTVENYREKIQEKIGAKNMVGIAVYGIKHGIFKL